MINKNNKTFQRILEKFKHTNMIFLGSNSGTGKTTSFKWTLLRKALKGKLRIDFIFRFEADLEQKFNDDKFLTPPEFASKRLLKLQKHFKIIKTNSELGNDYFLINKKTGERLGQGICVNTQRKFKSTENAIFSNFAFFDEVMPDDNVYCQDEVYKFSRLIDSRARFRKYFVLGLYNNTNPYFPYRTSFEKAGAKFINFVGEKVGQEKEKTGIQKILSLSDYGEVYNNNNYKYYKEFYKNVKVKGKTTTFYIYLQNFLFAVKDLETYFVLIPKKKIKKNREVFSLELQENDFQMLDNSNNLLNALQNAITKRAIFVNNKRYTVFIKTLADYLNLCYNV